MLFLLTIFYIYFCYHWLQCRNLLLFILFFFSHDIMDATIGIANAIRHVLSNIFSLLYLLDYTDKITSAAAMQIMSDHILKSQKLQSES